MAASKLVLGCLLLNLTSCHPPLPSKTTLKIPFASYPETFDPRKASDFASSTLVCLLFEGLTRCTGGDEIEMALCKEVTISEDQLIYQFTLRPSVWSDGTPVTAFDFERSWKEALSLPSASAYLFYPIQNAEKFSKGLVSSDEVGIHAKSATRLEVILEEPTPYFLSLTAFPLYLPGATGKNNGPFQLSSKSSQGEILLEKNPLFWNRDKTLLEAISVQIIPDPMVALELFERGELDLAGGPLSPLPPDAIDSLKDKGLYSIPMAASTFCTFNIQEAPFSNPKFRQALALALDRDLLAQEVAQMEQIPAQHLLPPSFQIEGTALSFDLEKAKVLFKEALQEEGSIPPITLFYKPNPTDKRLAQLLASMWKDSLNLHIDLMQLEPKSLLSRLYHKHYQCALSSWIAQFHDPINILERFKDPKGLKNYPGWNHFGYQSLLEIAKKEVDPALRKKHLEEAEALLAQENLFIPLYHWSSPTLKNPHIQGLVSTSSGGVLFEKCWIQDFSKDPL